MTNLDNQTPEASSIPMNVEKETKDQEDISTVQQMLSQMEQILKTTEVGSKLYDQSVAYIQQLKPLLDENKPLTDKGKALLKKANNFVQEKPLLSAGLAAGAGVLLTMLFNNKKK